MNPVLVTGATGTVGRHLVRELARRDVPVRAFVRDPARAAVSAVEPGVELAVGDLADAASIRAALDGVERVFLCEGNQPDQVAHETGVIDTAAAAGVRRLVKLSARGAEPGSPFGPWDAHGRIETHLRRSGVPSVVLAPTMYMSHLLADATTIGQSGRLFAPAADAPVAMIDPRDVAAVAATVLTEDGHEGRTYVLTGPTAPTYHEVARQLTAALGRSVEYVDVPDAVARDAMVAAGLPEWLADAVVVLWGELRRGAAATPTDVVRVLTGREARSVADFARDVADAFGPGGQSSGSDPDALAAPGHDAEHPTRRSAEEPCRS